PVRRLDGLDKRISASHPAEPSADGKSSHMSEPKTVLLVEDNEDNRIVYATMLEHYGYKVVETANGEDAVRIAHEKHPDLILMDISIPGIDGWTATERIR